MKAAIRGPAEDEKMASTLSGPYFGRVSVLAHQQGFAQIATVGEFGSPGLDL